MTENLAEKEYIHYDQFLYDWIREIEMAINTTDNDSNTTSASVEQANFITAASSETQLTDNQFPIHEKMKKVDIDSTDNAISHLRFMKNLLKSNTGDKKTVDIIYDFLAIDLSVDQRGRYDEAVRQIYIEKLNEKIAMLIMQKFGFQIYATRVLMREYSSERDVETYKLLTKQLEYYARRYKKLSEILYGKPDKLLFDFTVSALIADATQMKTSPRELNQKTAQEFLEKFGNINIEDVAKLQTLLPTDEILADYKSQVIENSRIAEFIDLVDNDLNKDLTAHEIAELFRKYLDFMHDGQQHEWEVVVEADRKTMAVDQEENKIYIGENQIISKKRTISLILHEIYTHVGKRIQGEKSKLILLGFGLPGYTDEGTATAREKIFEDSISNFSGTENYFAISLAYGLDKNPNQPRNFIEVYKLMITFYKFWLIKSNPEEEYSETALNKDAIKKAYARTMRIFRGSPMTVSGVVHTEDLDYKRDSVLVWQIINKSNQLGVKIDSRFNIGKFNLADTKSLYYLQQLDIFSEEDINLLSA